MQELDSDPWLLGVRNGVIDLRSGALRRNEPKLLITRRCNASYVVNAECPRWLMFLKQVFKGENKDPFLEQKLLKERDGILRWMIEGTVMWHKDGLNLSQTIRRECTSYRKESELLGEFLSEECRPALSERVLQTDLFDAWRDWCTDNGVRYSSKASFTRRLAERGYGDQKSNSKRYYAGLKLISWHDR